jgi:polyferredoxin
MPLWLGIFAISLLVAIGWGRLFCGYVCPMNTSCSRWMAVQKLGWQSNASPDFPYPLAALCIAGTVGAGVLLTSPLLQQEFPLLPVFDPGGAGHPALEAGAFHNGLCPFGVLQRLAGKGRATRKPSIPPPVSGAEMRKGVPLCGLHVCRRQTRDRHHRSRLVPSVHHCVPVCPTASIRYRKVREQPRKTCVPTVDRSFHPP